MARPREFDEERVLEAARDAFWEHGYEGTSTRDLVKYTGMTQPSLYNAFGDKRALFRRALEHYLDHTLRSRLARLKRDFTPALAITAYFAEVIQRSSSDIGQRGCMLVNAVLEKDQHADGLQEAIASELAEIRGFFRASIVAARKHGEMPKGVGASDASAHLLTVLLGMRVLARMSPDPKLLRAAVEVSLATLGLPPLHEAEHHQTSR
ncbi:TetR/AcrR family transcriptional regulator [Paraburkholderia sp. C35]|uniref:TetR/AcrR family transcriptional regulator n=1 Tax=Paraburkholderia sp. C35 TaxID=2126993 RepID=UPI000D68FCB2|nr:TetR/AcrR family transcriptional regulator [Paraburkholderia sp. C35]